MRNPDYRRLEEDAQDVGSTCGSGVVARRGEAPRRRSAVSGLAPYDRADRARREDQERCGRDSASGWGVGGGSGGGGGGRGRGRGRAGGGGAPPAPPPRRRAPPPGGAGGVVFVVP